MKSNLKLSKATGKNVAALCLALLMSLSLSCDLVQARRHGQRLHFSDSESSLESSDEYNKRPGDNNNHRRRHIGGFHNHHHGHQQFGGLPPPPPAAPPSAFGPPMNAYGGRMNGFGANGQGSLGYIKGPVSAPFIAAGEQNQQRFNGVQQPPSAQQQALFNRPNEIETDDKQGGFKPQPNGGQFNNGFGPQQANNGFGFAMGQRLPVPPLGYQRSTQMPNAYMFFAPIGFQNGGQRQPQQAGNFNMADDRLPATPKPNNQEFEALLQQPGKQQPNQQQQQKQNQQQPENNNAFEALLQQNSHTTQQPIHAAQKPLVYPTEAQQTSAEHVITSTTTTTMNPREMDLLYGSNLKFDEDSKPKEREGKVSDNPSMVFEDRGLFDTAPHCKDGYILVGDKCRLAV